MLVLLGGVVVINIAQPNRPTVSELENRELAKFPKFTLTSLADGSYFSGISTFISDTFIARDTLVELSKHIDSLRGVKYSIGGGDNFVVIDTPVDKNQGEEDYSDLIGDALNNLNSETKAPETDPPETVAPETDAPDETTDPDDVIIEPGAEQLENGDIIEVIGKIVGEESEVDSIVLSKESLNLTVGSGAVVSASVTTSDKNGAKVRWSVSDPEVVSLNINTDGGVSVKVHDIGECVITCEAENGVSAICTITVSEIFIPADNQTTAEADFLPNGLFIYGDAVYTHASYVESAAKTYAQTALYYKRLFGEDTRVSMVVAPVSAMVIDNPEVTSKINDQKTILEKMGAHADPSVNFVNVYSKMYEHRDEYLFFKSDHHWTGRGAYYAYAAFAESLGFEPTPLDEFEYDILSDSYSGSMYSYTHSPLVATFKDSVEVFYPTKAHTMTITDVNGKTHYFNSSIVSGHRNYLSFISGDHPYTVINVPENPQDRNIIVLKDSFGNAFVPYLCEHYGNIFVVDVRHTSMNIFEQFADYDITDIVFVNNIQAANSTAWSQMYMKAVGVELK